MDRFEKLLDGLTKTTKILEIGPSYSPLTPRSQGWNSYILDHATQEELQEKYKNEPVLVSQIEKVDFVWRSGSLDGAVPHAHLGTFDACIASHVIEHCPDLIGFLSACRRILRPAGKLCLAVPDKRYCFDYFKQVSTTAEVLDTHFRQRQRHSKQAAFRTVAYNVLLNGVGAWGQHPIDSTLAFETSNSLFRALDAYHQHPEADNAEYRDLHGWYFTPSSFELLVLELTALGLVSFSVEKIYKSEGCEFIVILNTAEPLKLDPETLDRRRLQLLRRVLLEMREQAEYLAAGLGIELTSPG